MRCGLASWTDVMDRVESLKFSDGSIVKIEDQVSGAISSVIYNMVTGGSGNDVLDGTVGADKMTAAEGNDFPQGLGRERPVGGWCW